MVFNLCCMLAQKKWYQIIDPTRKLVEYVVVVFEWSNFIKIKNNLLRWNSLHEKLTILKWKISSIQNIRSVAHRHLCLVPNIPITQKQSPLSIKQPLPTPLYTPGLEPQSVFSLWIYLFWIFHILGSFSVSPLCLTSFHLAKCSHVSCRW